MLGKYLICLWCAHYYLYFILKLLVATSANIDYIRRSQLLLNPDNALYLTAHNECGTRLAW